MAVIQSLFPTRLYRADLPRAKAAALNAELERTCHIVAKQDKAGQAWARENRYSGYTSYASLNDLSWRAPVFADLEAELQAHIAAFARDLQFDLAGRKLVIDSLWINILKPGGVHTAHIHPHSVLSGTYYVAMPEGAGGLKLEDPRLAQMMAAPPRKVNARLENRSFVYLDPKPGRLFLWESWLRHEVQPHTGKGPRISISFNCAWG